MSYLKNLTNFDLNYPIKWGDMGKTIIFWILSLLITLGGAYYQRKTGPTYPVSGKILLGDKVIKYHLERSHSSSSDYNIKLNFGDPSIKGILSWKRYKTDDEFVDLEMKNKNGVLTAELPKQPPAGKLQYKIKVISDKKAFKIPPENSIIIRFKGDVPLFILLPHIIAMFGTMLLSTRTGLEVFNKEANLKKYTYTTLGFLIIGGMILGPLTQLYAFGALWTGFPFGTDLTDNKTLIALIGWLIAAFALNKSKNPKGWIIFAAILLLVIYSIPHSMFGSELDYSKMNK